MVLKDELIMLFQFYFNDFCRFRKRKGKDRRRRGKRAEGRRQKTACLYPLKNGQPPEGAIRWKNIGACPMLSEIFF